VAGTVEKRLANVRNAVDKRFVLLYLQVSEKMGNTILLRKEEKYGCTESK